MVDFSLSCFSGPVQDFPLQQTAPPLFGLVMAAFALFLVLIIHLIIVKAVQRKRKFMNDWYHWLWIHDLNFTIAKILANTVLEH